MDNVRWGLVSTANINRRVIPAIRASSRGTLMAVASRSKEIADAYAKQWEIPLAFDSYQAMLDSDQVDAVYIGLPNHLHAEWSIRAMLAGKNVLCEKPIAVSVNEIDQMIVTSEQTGRVLAEAFMYRHHPQTKLVGEWVRSGRLGEIAGVRSVFNFTIKNKDNIRLGATIGGGCLWDVGIYPVSFAQYIFQGAPQSVFATQRLGESDVDLDFFAQMSYVEGKTAQIQSSFRLPFYTMAEIIGSEGRLWLDKPFIGINSNTNIVLFTQDSEPQYISSPVKYLYLGEIEDIHAAILDGNRPYLDLYQSRYHIQTALALYRISQNGLCHLSVIYL